MTRTLPLLPGLGGIYRRPRRCLLCRGTLPSGSDGELQAERGAAAAPVGDFNGTTMLLNDTVGHRESQARAFARGLGGEEGIVDAVDMLGRDAGTAIGHFNPDARAFSARADLEGAAARHGVTGVEEQVQE